jgi:signal transduction histidine kinase
MKTLRIYEKLNIGLYLLNGLTIVFLFTVILSAMQTTVFRISAASMLEDIPALPRFLPQVAFVYAILLFISLSVSQYLKYQSRQYTLIVWFLIYDILACLWLQFFMLQYLRGILWMALLNILFFLKGKNKYRFLAIYLAFVVLVDFSGTIPVGARLPFDRYVAFFEPSARMILYIVKYILVGGSDLIFFVSIFLLLADYAREKETAFSMYHELAQSNKELQLAYFQLRELSAQAEQQAVQNERTRIAMELHDTIGHGLTAIMMGIEACGQLLTKLQDPIALKLKTKFAKIKEIAQGALQDARRAVASLKPILPEPYDLIASMTQLFNRLNETGNIRIYFKHSTTTEAPSPPPPLKEEIALNIYRIAQEALTNAIRHGKAGQIQVVLSIDTTIITLEIQDDGIGSKLWDPGLGINGIEQRVKALNGSITVDSSPNRGFWLFISIPNSDKPE